MKIKKISYPVLNALKEALAHIYFRKDDLKKFVENTIQSNGIIATIDWTNPNQPKFESCSQLIDRMANNQNHYQEDLITLIIEVSNFSDFSNLEWWDKNKGTFLTVKAKMSVDKLKTLTHGFSNSVEEAEKAEERKNVNAEKIKSTLSFNERLIDLRKGFSDIALNKNFQKRGYLLESLLHDLFQLFDLDPRASFKLSGEQIDGSFTFKNTDYIVEARWVKDQVNAADLYVFGAKISKRIENTLGLFVSIDGYTPEAIQPNHPGTRAMILMDGQDLIQVLDGRVSLNDMLLIKRRRAADTGQIYFNVMT